MSEVKRYYVNLDHGTRYSPVDGCDQAMNKAEDFDLVTAERDALQQRLTAADERADVLETEVARLNRVKLSIKELADSRADNCSVYRQHLTVALALAEKVRDANLGMQRKFLADLIDHLHQRGAALKPAGCGGGDHVKHYECIGKGGDYTVVAIAQGAGTLKGFNHYVYKNADGVHFVRDPEDFLSRMQIKP